MVNFVMEWYERLVTVTKVAKVVAKVTQRGALFDMRRNDFCAVAGAVMGKSYVMTELFRIALSRSHHRYDRFKHFALGDESDKVKYRGTQIYVVVTGCFVNSSDLDLFVSCKSSFLKRCEFPVS